jgi:RNA polymerase sigma-70 factor, ECF subfamily
MTPSDDALVHVFLATGLRSAVDELVRRHHAAVRSLLRRLCRDAALADDLAQETFLKAIDRLDRYGAQGRFRSWLGGIAYNEFLMSLRSDRRRRNAQERAAVETGLTARAMDAGLIDLDRALDQLPEPERIVIILNQGCGMSHSEIASSMALPLGTVKTRIDRARKQLQAHLDDGSDG